MAYKKSSHNKPVGTAGNMSVSKGCWYRHINGLVNETGMAIIDFSDGEFCQKLMLPVIQYDIVETNAQGVEQTVTKIVPKYYYGATKLTICFTRVEHIQTSTGMGYVFINDDPFELIMLNNVYYDLDFEDMNIHKVTTGGGSIDSQFYAFFTVAVIHETDIPDEATNIVEPPIQPVQPQP